MEDLEIIRIRLEDYFDDKYKTIWVQRGGRPSQRDILVTLFPKDGSQYEMVFLKNLSKISYEEILNKVEKELSKN